MTGCRASLPTGQNWEAPHRVKGGTHHTFADISRGGPRPG